MMDTTTFKLTLAGLIISIIGVLGSSFSITLNALEEDWVWVIVMSIFLLINLGCLIYDSINMGEMLKER